MLWLTLAAAAAAFAAWVYLRRERLGSAGFGFAALRTAALLGLIALLANLGLGRRFGPVPVTVALDASLSMQRTGLQWDLVLDSARTLAGREGVVQRFGDGVASFDSTPPTDGRSRVGDVLTFAAARGGEAFVITDGELEDFHALPAPLRDRARLVHIARAPVPGLALTEVALPARVLARDTIDVTLEITTWGGFGDSLARLLVRLGGRTLMDRDLGLPGGAGRGRRTLRLPPGTLGDGTHVLEFEVVAAGDPHGDDNRRLRVVEVAGLPAGVLVASRLDWEARFLARELADIVPGGFEAYGDLGGGRWVDLRTQRRVAASRVGAAVQAAALVVVRGDAPLATNARRRWDWPGTDVGGLPGEWYVTGVLPASPLGSRLAVVPWDSLPPLTGISSEPPRGLVAIEARLGRRGAQRPVLLVSDSAGRRVVRSTAAGFWRWAFRGGTGREAYRSLLAAGVEWLMQGSAQRGTVTVTATPVVPRGYPVTFERRPGSAVPDSVVVEIRAADTVRQIPVIFRADGRAEARLDPGIYRWRMPAAAGSGGVVAVETFSPEFVPRAVVRDTPAPVAGPGTPVGLRDVWWVFPLVVLIFVLEWAWRMRRGLP